MGYALRVAAPLLVLLVFSVPLPTFADSGPCPDDPAGSTDCDAKPPDYYVVVNRSLERLGPQYGSGCQPWILQHPECKDCASGSDACLAAAIDVEQIICGSEMPTAGAKEGDTLWEMCCNCPSTDPSGTWMFRERTLRKNPTTGAWECPDFGDWQPGLPPDTGIDLPAPVVIGGLAILGTVLAALGMVVRRRVPRSA